MLTDYGKVCRALRVIKMMCMCEQSKKMGISSAQLSGIEIGKYELTEELLDKTVDILADCQETKELIRFFGNYYLVDYKAEMTY